MAPRHVKWGKESKIRFSCRAIGRQPTSGQNRHCYCKTSERACRIVPNRLPNCCSTRTMTERKRWVCSRHRESNGAEGLRQPSPFSTGRTPTSVPAIRSPLGTIPATRRHCTSTSPCDWRNCSTVANCLAIRRSTVFQSRCWLIKFNRHSLEIKWMDW